MFPSYRTRLFSDLESWTDQGLISAEAAAVIRDRYPLQNDGVLVALIYVSVILLGAGLIALVASNWQDIPRPVRVGGLLLLDIAIVGACAFLSQRKPPGAIAIEALAALSIISAGASISLVGQMYHFPADWPAFGRSMIVVALATAVVARSTSALWLGAAALGWFVQSFGGEFGLRDIANDIDWGPRAFEIGLYSVALIALALSPWTNRAGPWTMLVVLLPALWWFSVGSTMSRVSVVPIPLIAVALLLLVQFGPARLGRRQFRDALSALTGAQVIAIVAFAAANELSLAAESAYELSGAKGGWLGSAAAAAVGFVAACLPLIKLRGNAAPWFDPDFWRTFALATCGIIGFNFPLKGHLAELSWLVPLAALAVEARISDRNKTFGAIVVAFLGLIVLQMGAVKDLRTFAAVLLAGGVVAMMILLAVRRSTATKTAGHSP